jgi:hypothetical protein
MGACSGIAETGDPCRVPINILDEALSDALPADYMSDIKSVSTGSEAIHAANERSRLLTTKP